MTATVKTELVENNALLVSWDGLGDDETGPGASVARWANRSVQAFGTFASGVVSIEGSNDGTNWSVLNDLEGAALNDIAAASIRSIMETTRFLRPVCSSAGGPTTDISLRLYAI